jgi:hypothetical protein
MLDAPTSANSYGRIKAHQRIVAPPLRRGRLACNAINRDRLAGEIITHDAGNLLRKDIGIGKGVAAAD